MHKIIDKIRQHQGAIGKYPLPKEAQIPYVRDLSLALVVELSEMLRELPWKPWAQAKGPSFEQRVLALEELTDVFIFAFALAVALGMEPLLEASILTKIEINMTRLKSGVHTKHI